MNLASSEITKARFKDNEVITPEALSGHTIPLSLLLSAPRQETLLFQKNKYIRKPSEILFKRSTAQIFSRLTLWGMDRKQDIYITNLSGQIFTEILKAGVSDASILYWVW